MKTILVHIDSDDGMEARLQAAFDLARAFEGHLHCVQITPYTAYAIGDPGMGGFGIAGMIEAIEKQRQEQRTAVEARLRKEGLNWDWIGRDGDSGDRLTEAARLADVIVLNSGPFETGGGMRLALTGEVAINSPTPVVAVSPASRGIAVTGAALIAWDGSQEAAQAMRAALPMLKLAESVDILTVAEKPSDFRAVWLSRHGVEAEVIERADEGGVEAVIRAVLAERRSAWMVQGAYGHSRLRQTLFGGVTRGLLTDAPVPLLLAH